MKKYKYLTIFISFLFFSCNEKILTIEKNEINIGKLRTNEKKEINIQINNESNTSINILKIQPSCKCIINNNLKTTKTLKPNDVFELKITYKSEEKGDFNETIVIYSDSEKPFEIIKIKSSVI
ncbi:DUF1573 domain-containing protein [Flavobacterium sp.]|uniref:DUF1573 domain-containing protein n=1 Tax=Flavobacterium sp. TaxID=239 RepID=UPI0033418A4C